jgi:muramoyltetrapeptide carboxypeptidase
MSIHGQMPYTFHDATPESLQSLRGALFGEPLKYEYSSSFPNRRGSAEGTLIGGNLTMLVMLEGSLLKWITRIRSYSWRTLANRSTPLTA